MKKLSQFIVTHSKKIVIFVVLLTLLGVTQVKNLKVEDDITKYLSENDPEIKFYQEISEKFGKYDENLTLVSLEYDDLFELENLQNFKTIAEQLEKSAHVLSVNSFLNMPKIITTDFGIEVREFVEDFPKTKEEAQQLKITALGDELVKGSYLSPDGQVGLLMVESQDNVNGFQLKQGLENIINQYKTNIKRIEYYGLPIMETQITEMALNNISLAFIATLVVLTILFYCFRSVQGTILPILIALITSFWLLSSIASSGKTVTIVISAIPVLMIALVTAYGIHFISRYYEERNYLPPQEAVGKTIESVFIPILMSALTTMAGFVSLATVVIRPMTEFGVFATIGIFLAFLLVIFLLGSIFSNFIPKKVPANFSYHANDFVTRILKITGETVINKSKLVIVFIILAIALSITFSFQVESDSSMENRLGQNNPITQTINYFKEKFGGVDFLYVYMEADNIKHPYILRSIDKIQKYARRLPSLSQPSSITTFLTQLNDAMENKRIIPANPNKIDNLWFFSGDNDYLNSMIADENQHQSTILQIRSYEMTSSAVESSISQVEQFTLSIPNSVKAINLNELSQQEREHYFPYIVEDIISSWQANGKAIENREIIKEKLLQIASLPMSNFIKPTRDFTTQIIHLSTLELEDFGISSTEIQPMILNYLEDYPEEMSFIENLIREFDISVEDAEYLKNVIQSSIAIAEERERISVARDEIEKLLNKPLNQEDADYLWYLTDDVVYIPDQLGDTQFSYRLTGIPVITNEVNNSVYQGQIKSMLAAFIFVCLLLILQFGSIQIGLIGMIPIIFTILTAFGIMGMAKISLNIGTMMVASIAIGAGIDYTIHFINRYKQELIKNNDSIKAIRITLTGTGRAIIFNSLSVAAGAFVLALSEIKMISEFASLIGSVMLISVVYTLLLLPLLLRFAKFKEENR
ncbi:MAG: MMPL family transporter [Candidatus Atribacteria bacterium]|nr:MMPL family transporter [Candidatus Atribacteria bacterium]